MSEWITSPTRDNEQRLIWHAPSVPEQLKRHLLLSVEVRSAIDGPWDNAEEERRLAYLRGDLDAFVTGRRISIALDPYDKDKKAYLAKVDPAGADIWDLRSIDPSPGVRVLGCFAEKDLFVALVWSFG